MSRHKAEVVCQCGRKIKVSLVLDGLTREGETPKAPKPIGPPIPGELLAVLASTRNFQALAAPEFGAWWETQGQMIEPFDVYIDEQLRKADAWLESNPRSRRLDYRRFLNTWLKRATDDAARRAAPGRTR